ncbi:MAG: hypothetical protein KBT11_05425 [Treponema sp.]|nr:hypothetical protein [Candidatus Treponema equifaecale]
MKKIKKLLLSSAMLLAACVIPSTFISCSEDNEEDSPKQDFSLNSIVSVQGLKYEVVNNTISHSKSIARAAGTNAAVESIERTKKFAEESFGNNILLLRVSGKVTVPQGEKDKYIKAYNAVMPLTIPSGFYATEFFTFNSTSDDKKVTYADTYLVLGSEDVDNIVGNIKATWNSSVTNSFKDADGSTKTLSDMLIAYNTAAIRNVAPEEFKTTKTDGYVLKNTFTNSDGIVIKESSPVPNCGYYRESKTKKPTAAANHHIYWNDDGSFNRADIDLYPVYGGTAGYYGAVLNVCNDNGTYKYYISGYNSTKTSKTEFTFTDGKFKADSIKLKDLTTLQFGADVTHYDSQTLPYTEAIRTIPISFVLKDDGTVDFGEEVYEWAENWTKEIIKNNPTRAGAYKD